MSRLPQTFTFSILNFQFLQAALKTKKIIFPANRENRAWLRQEMKAWDVHSLLQQFKESP